MTLRRRSFRTLRKLFNSVASVQNSTSSSIPPLQGVHADKETIDVNEATNLIKKNSTVDKFFNGNSNSLQKLNSSLKKFLKPEIDCKVLYSFVLDDTVAEKIVNHVIRHVDVEKNVVFESNPGLGLITHFLRLKINKLQVFEDEVYTELFSERLFKKDSNIDLKASNIFAPSHNSIQTLINFIISSNNTGTVSSIIGVTPSNRFFSNLVLIICEKNLRDCLSSVQFYIAVSNSVYFSLTDYEKSRGRFYLYCMFNLMFEIELLDVFPRYAFLPPSKTLQDKMYLLKITSRKDTFDYISEKNIKMFCHFVRVLEKSKFHFIIPTLEKYVPDCGPLLISKGVSMTMQTRDLTAFEAMNLFNLCTMCNSFVHYESLVKYENEGEFNFKTTQDLTL